MEQAVQEYFKNYFGGTINESTDEEIMEAVYDLIALKDAVLDAVGLNEKAQPNLKSKFQTPPPKGYEKQPPRGYDPKADYRADRDKHMNTKFRSQADQDASYANRKNWGR
jgi:hypothetical protein